MTLKTQKYFKVVDLEGLKAADRDAYDTFVAADTLDPLTEHGYDNGNYRFGQFSDGSGWDVIGEGSPLAYNPVHKDWTFYEYCDEDELVEIGIEEDVEYVE